MVLSERKSPAARQGLGVSLALVIAVCLGINLLAPPPIAAEAVAPLHNSDRFACSLPEFLTAATCTANGGSWNPSRKWQGGWGVAGEKYGSIQCGTCHTRNPGNGNIKLLRPSLTAPDGSALPVGSGAVVAQEAIADVASDFGDDADAHTSSARICEVCHSRTRFHRFDTSEQLAAGGSLGHFNRNDCITCHRHQAGFRPVCSDCHGNSSSGESWPDGLANNTLPGYAYADDSGSHSTHVFALGGNASCALCHPVPDSGASHLNGNVDVAGPAFTFTRENLTCGNIVCHGNSDAHWGSSGCLGCHAVAQGARVAVGAQFSANSHHVQGVLVTDTHCYVCHWEAQSDGSIAPAYHGGASASGAAVDLVIYGTGTRPLSPISGVTAIAYRANGTRSEIAKLNSHCLGCHRDQNDTAKPFGDGKTPKSYAWDGASVASRFNQLGSAPWGKYAGPNVTPKSARRKAYSAHGNASANQGGWDLNETWPNTRNGAENVACFDCHNSHGSNVIGTTVSYTSGTVNGGLLKQTQAGYGGYQTSYAPVAGGTAAGKNERNPGASLCMDCHYTANAGSAQPWGFQSSFGASATILGYYDSPFFAGGSAGAQSRYAYKGAALNQGGHFGVSSPLAGTVMGSIGGLCTPCHDPHGVSPTLSSNQPYGVPLLKGTWLTSPYLEDVAQVTTGYMGNPPSTFRIDQNTFGVDIRSVVTGISETPAQFAGLCLNCHGKTSLTDGVTHTWKGKDRIHESVKGWKTANGTVKHNYPCAKCHSPHNGAVLPRLMVSNCMDSTHNGRVAGPTAPQALSGTGGGDVGYGSGGMPGSFSYCDEYNCVDGSVSCHEGATGGVDQRWNRVTPWEPALQIAGVAVSSFRVVSGEVYASASWTSNILGDATVEFGLSEIYGTSSSNPAQLTAHTVTLSNLLNHATYHYKARSVTSGGQSASTADQVFNVDVPPTVPVPTPHLDAVCPGDCAQTLSWGASSDPDGGSVEYQVEIDTVNTFASGNKQTSAWSAGLSTTFTFPTGHTWWYWRLKARDAGHVNAESVWSDISAFRITTVAPPPTPTLVLHGNYDSGCANTLVTVQWNPVVSPDGDPVEYFVSTDAYGNSGGWLPATTTSWQFTLPAAAGVTWQVVARDAVHPDSVSLPGTEYFFDIGSACWSSSCPLIFAWNGSGYDYESDLQGPIIGLPPSNIKKDTNLYQPTSLVMNGLREDANGEYRVKIRESLPEITYVDEAKLLAIDYPAGYEIVTSGAENTYNYGYVNPFSIQTVKDPLPLVAATDDRGADVLPSLLAVDNRPAVVEADRVDTYYTLDFGAVRRPQYAKLLIDGWSIYGVKKFKSDVTIQPYIEVVNQSGEWVKVKSFGTPAGDLKTMVIELPNLFLCADQRLRLHLGIRRGARWVIDRVRLDDSAPVPITVKELSARFAELHAAGVAIQAMSTLDSRIVASDLNLPLNLLLPSFGRFTRYGDVLPLLLTRDDQFAIIREGDGIALTFPSAGALPQGRSRGFILKADIYYKTLTTSNQVEPLPFHAMSDYPYPAPEAYPLDSEHLRYLEEYNTRNY